MWGLMALLLSFTFTALPGFVLLLLCGDDFLRGRSLTCLALTSIGLGFTYIAVIGYILDLTIGVNFLHFLTASVVFFSIILLNKRHVVALSIKYLKVNVLNVYKNFELDIFMLSLLLFYFMFSMWAPVTQDFIFPSDPVIWIFLGRWIAINNHWALFIREATQGFIMTQSFGFHYWLAFLFSYHLPFSYDIMRFAGPLFGVFTLLSVYELVRKMTKSKLAASFSMLVLQTSYLWIWAQRLTTEYTTIGFMLPLTMLLLYEYFERGKKFSDLLIVFVIVGGLWLYHPPSAILFILPATVCYILKWRKIIKFSEVTAGLLTFIAITFVYWALLNSNSVAERLKNVTVAKTMDFLSYKVLVEGIWTPFQQVSGIIASSAILMTISIIWGLRDKTKDHHSPKVLIFELVLALFLIEYFYWIFPSPAIRAVFDNVYPAERMLVHLPLPMSILCALGYGRLTNLLNRNGLAKTYLRRKLGEHLNSKIKVPVRIIAGSFIILITFMQIQWGYSNFNTYSQFYPYQMTNDGARMIQWIDNNLPLNCTILIDDYTTADYQTVSQYGTHGFISNIASRGNGWLAFATLYPRDIIGNPNIFEEAEAHNGSGFADFIKKYNVDYVLITNPRRYPVLTLALRENLVHKEGDALLFSLPTMHCLNGPKV